MPRKPKTEDDEPVRDTSHEATVLNVDDPQEMSDFLSSIQGEVNDGSEGTD